MKKNFMKEIDLHNTSHHIAKEMVIRSIEDNFNSGNQIIIVTGNSESMKAICLSIASEYGLRAITGSPYDGNNSGYITIWT